MQQLTKQALLSGNYCIQVDTQEQWEKLCKWIGAPESFLQNQTARYLYTGTQTKLSFNGPYLEHGHTLIHYSAIDFSEELKVGDKVTVRGVGMRERCRYRNLIL